MKQKAVLTGNDVNKEIKNQWIINIEIIIDK